MVLGNVEETIHEIEVSKETEEQHIKVSFHLVVFFWFFQVTVSKCYDFKICFCQRS